MDAFLQNKVITSLTSTDDFLSNFLVNLVKILHLHPYSQLFFQKLFVLLPSFQQLTTLPQFMDFERLDQLLYLVVQAIWFDYISWSFQIFFYCFNRLKYFSLKQIFGHVDILNLLRYRFDEQIWDFPSINDSGCQAYQFSVSPNKVCWRVDLAKRSQKLVIVDRKRKPHISSSMLAAIKLSAGQKEVVPEVGVRKMMNENISALSILVFSFFFQSAGVFDEVAEKYIKQRFDLLRSWRAIGPQLNFLIAQGLVNFSDLVSVVVDVSHHILVQMQFLSLPFDFLENIAHFTSIEPYEEITQDVNTGKYISIMTIQNIFFVSILEKPCFLSHLLQITSLQVLFGDLTSLL